MDVQPQTPMHQELSTLHRLTKFFTLGFLTTCRSQKATGDATTSMGRTHQGLACCPEPAINPNEWSQCYSCYAVMPSGSMLAGCHASVWEMLNIPQESKVLLFLLCCYGCIYKKPHEPKTYRLAQTDKVFYFGVSHNLQKPEGYRGCHNLNPNREWLVWVFQHVEGYTMLSMLGIA